MKVPSILVVLVTLGMAGVPAVRALASITHGEATTAYWNITVAKHRDMTTSEMYVDTHLSVASAILYTDDDVCDDFICCNIFRRNGDMGEYPGDDFAIYSASQGADLVLSAPHQGFMVMAITNVGTGIGSMGAFEAIRAFNNRKFAIDVNLATSNAWAIAMAGSRGIGSTQACPQDLLYEPFNDLTTQVALSEADCIAFRSKGDVLSGQNDCGTPISTFGILPGPYRLDVTWQESDKSRVVDYVIERATSCWGPSTQIAVINSHDPGHTADSTNYIFTDTTASYDIEYFYTVRADYEVLTGSGQPSPALAVATPTAPGEPVADLEVAPEGGIRASVSWSPAGAGVDHYAVFKGAWGDLIGCYGPHELLGVTTSTSIVDDSLPVSGGVSEYRVVAFSAVGVPSASPVGTLSPEAASLTIMTNQPGAMVVVNGVVQPVAVGGVVVPCTTLTTSSVISLSVEPYQEVAGTHFCFDGWSTGAPRSHVVQVLGDTTIALALVASGSGSPPFEGGAVLGSELTDCRGPYRFLGDATAPSGLTVYPGTKLRFPRAGGQSPYAGLTVSGQLTATGATFETVDSTETSVPTGAWKGVEVDGGWITLKNTTIRNATMGIASSSSWTTWSAQLDSCSFQKNNVDVNLYFSDSATPGKTLTLQGNWFSSKNAVQVTGAQFPGSSPVVASIAGNTFAGTTNGSKWLKLSAGFTGQVNNNLFNMANSGNIGVELYAMATYPNVSFTGNIFQHSSTQRTALVAPSVAGHPYIQAYNNSWNLSTAGEIQQSIVHFPDNNGKAEVLFEPFTSPPGGGGGGGGGCPFVLSQRADGTWELENSILGASESLQRSLALVRDACPLKHATVGADGLVHLRIAELEQETDLLDHVGLEAVSLPEGAHLGVGSDGAIVAFRPIEGSSMVAGWSGRNAPFVSPIAPGHAYTGEPGDSLELLISPSTTERSVIGRRFFISLVPKPQEARSARGEEIGVTVRVSSGDADQWTTLGPLVPRVLWSSTVLPLDLPESTGPQRVRIIWHTRHALGWAGLAEAVEPEERVSLPLRSARHSSLGNVTTALGAEGASSTTLQPGEVVDLEFEGSDVPQAAQLVLTARGRYQLGPTAPGAVPAVPYAEQNHPNPFNPHTEIRFGMPVPAHVRITVFDVGGRRVRTLEDRDLPAGDHAVAWDGTDSVHRPVASGVYFYQVKIGDFSVRRRMVLVR